MTQRTDRSGNHAGPPHARQPAARTNDNLYHGAPRPRQQGSGAIQPRSQGDPMRGPARRHPADRDGGDAGLLECVRDRALGPSPRRRTGATRRRSAGRSSPSSSGVAGRRSQVAAPKCSRLEPRPPDRFSAAIARTPAKRGRRGVEFERHAARRRHLGRVADEPEPGDVGAGVHGAADSAAATSAAARFSVVIDATAASASAAGARPNLIAVPTMPVPSGLVRISTSPARAPALVEDALRDRRAGHRVAELDLRGRAPCGRRAAPRRPRAACRSRRRKICADRRRASSPSCGKPAIASAVSGRPPIA